MKHILLHEIVALDAAPMRRRAREILIVKFRWGVIGLGGGTRCHGWFSARAGNIRTASPEFVENSSRWFKNE
jgi:hypothetical protein